VFFLIQYNRELGELEKLISFPDYQRHKAEDVRLELEMEHKRRGIEREVVLLEALDEAALRRTHRRYFANLAELADPSSRSPR